VKLYHQEWRTRLSLTPQTYSSAEVRAFQGDYRVTVKKDQQTLAELDFSLDGDTSFDCVFLLGSLDCVITSL